MPLLGFVLLSFLQGESSSKLEGSGWLAIVSNFPSYRGGIFLPVWELWGLGLVASSTIELFNFSFVFYSSVPCFILRFSVWNLWFNLCSFTWAWTPSFVFLIPTVFRFLMEFVFILLLTFWNPSLHVTQVFGTVVFLAPVWHSLLGQFTIKWPILWQILHLKVVFS